MRKKLYIVERTDRTVSPPAVFGTLVEASSSVQARDIFSCHYLSARQAEFSEVEQLISEGGKILRSAIVEETRHGS